ncbi:MAG: hypothetical protein K1X79_05945 [Oligoflexia bacterium]|nr:hypothetical protein [Oligoflexia bacterium]
METQATGTPGADTNASDTETLVVVSKVKKYIRAQSGLNTSQCCIDALTKKIVDLCTQAITNARNDGRKTVMGRDIL